MNRKILITLITILSDLVVNARQPDSLYVRPYTQKIRLMGYVSTSFIQLDNGDEIFTPNYPLTPGVGLALKNTVFGVQAGYGILPLKNQDKFGKSKTMDFNMHHYGRKIILDFFLQNFKGFYSEKKVRVPGRILPEMSVMHFGGEATYLFNGNRFSSKAAFYLSEIQTRSSGSWLLGGGTYYYKIKGLENNNSQAESDQENVQSGVNAGYAYSWVIDNYWMLSAMVKAGANFGNFPQEVNKGNFEVYPTAFARIAGNYHQRDWGVSMVVILGNKSVKPLQSGTLSLTNVVMQLSYVKHLDHLFKIKK